MMHTLFKYLFILTCIFYVGPASAATYYVAVNGSDSGAGTQSVPFRSVQKGVNTARAGDTIYVRAGTYYESIIMPYSGSAGSPITLSGYPGERPIINFQASQANQIYRMLLLQAEAGYQYPIGWIVIQGFELINGSDGIKIYNGHDIIVRDNIIHDSISQGLQGNGYKVVFDRNIIYHNGYENGIQTDYGGAGPNGSYGMYFNGTYITVTNNIFHSNTGFGIQISGYGYVPSENAGPEYATAQYWLVANNTFAYNGWTALENWNAYNNGHTANNTFENNIFFENAQRDPGTRDHGIDFYNSDGGHVIKNNLAFSSAGLPMIGAYPDPPESYYTGSNNYDFTDPKFVNASGYDFHLNSGSPAIDKGLAISTITKDFDGVSRPWGSAYDIGVYEYTGGTTALSGDINGDRIVNSLDWSLMSAKWLTNDTNADLNKDGAVNSLDWSIMSSNWLKTI